MLFLHKSPNSPETSGSLRENVISNPVLQFPLTSSVRQVIPPEIRNGRRETEGAPRNPAPRNHFLVWIVQSPGCHCTDAFGGKQYRQCRPLLAALPPSLRTEGERGTEGEKSVIYYIIVDRIIS